MSHKDNQEYQSLQQQIVDGTAVLLREVSLYLQYNDMEQIIAATNDDGTLIISKWYYTRLDRTWGKIPLGNRLILNQQELQELQEFLLSLAEVE
jgi:hypothetical protein